MKLSQNILFASAALALPQSQSPLNTVAKEKAPLPLVIWHGLGDNFQNPNLLAVGELADKINPGTFVHYVRLSDDAGLDRRATFLGNLTVQIEAVCKSIAEHPILSTAPALNALGFSQGGQFLRGLFQRCGKEEGVPPLNTLVTFGSQHNGISRFQGCDDATRPDWVCRGVDGLLRTGVWTSYAQNGVVPAQYFRDPDEEGGLEREGGYLDSSNFLADINNERATKNPTYKERLGSIGGKFVMYMFEDDTTVVPKESGLFAEVNSTSGEVTPLKERKIYKEDWLGLKKLDEEGKLVFRNTPGEHMRIQEKALTECFSEFFGPVEVDDGQGTQEL